MFEILKLRFFVAAVQAELKAQHNNQSFVNHICQLPENIEHLRQAREYAHFRTGKIGAFLAVCMVLGESLNSNHLSVDTKATCAELLAQRLQKVSANPQFRLQHLIFFGRLEERIAEWAEKYE